MNWISVKDKLPKLGQTVILCLKGVVQKETYIYDVGDLNDYATVSFWSRDDIDGCPQVTSEDLWMPLPEPPQHSEETK